MTVVRLAAALLFLALVARVRAQEGGNPSELGPREAYRRINTGFFDLEKNVPASAEEIELGRRLFFDPRLAGDKSMSCSTCHQPEKAWSDGLPRARGLHKRELARNTPSLFNASRNIPHNFFWDGRAVMMEDAILTALHSPVEMNRDLSTLAADLGAVPDYARRFAAVFGPGDISARAVGHALASFVRAEIRIGVTPFDRFRTDPSALDAAQKRGLVLFVGKARCLLCHAGPFFSDDSHHNNGLKPNDELDDPGRFAIDRNPIYWRAFKTPPLRNVSLTAPYMHDGRFATLEEVVEFYNRGGDTSFRDENIRPLNLTDREKKDLVSFLGALTGPPSRVAVPVP